MKCSVLMYDIITLLKMICNKCVQYYSQWTTWLSYTILCNYFIIQDFYELSYRVMYEFVILHMSAIHDVIFLPHIHLNWLHIRQNQENQKQKLYCPSIPFNDADAFRLLCIEEVFRKKRLINSANNKTLMVGKNHFSIEIQ